MGEGEAGNASRRGLRAFPALFPCVVLASLLAASLTFPAVAASGKTQRTPFEAFVSSLWPLAESRGVSRATFERAFAGLSPDPNVIAQSRSQPEFVLPTGDYVAGAVTAGRVERGKGKASEARVWLDQASRAYGVDTSILLGIWGLETDFGGFAGTSSVIRSLATLAFVGFRGDYCRGELLSALEILEEGDVALAAMRGSWAGAMGQTQFMPTSYLVYAVDFEKHGRRDIWTSEADAIGSTANFLKQHGWTAGLPWGFEVRLPQDFALTGADSARAAPFSAFAARGVERADGSPLPEKGEGRLLILAGIKGPVFLVTSNFDVIKAYNNSTAYALAVGLLGDAIAGGPAPVAPWPAAGRPLTAQQVTRLQAELKAMGYEVGEIDGKAGDSLRAAVRAYQERNGLAPDGYADLALMERIAASR